MSDFRIYSADDVSRNRWPRRGIAAGLLLAGWLAGLLASADGEREALASRSKGSTATPLSLYGGDTTPWCAAIGGSGALRLDCRLRGETAPPAPL